MGRPELRWRGCVRWRQEELGRQVRDGRPLLRVVFDELEGAQGLREVVDGRDTAGCALSLSGRRVQVGREVLTFLATFLTFLGFLALGFLTFFTFFGFSTLTTLKEPAPFPVALADLSVPLTSPRLRARRT